MGLSFQFGPMTERVAVPVTIVDDMLVEGEEDLMLSLSSATVGGQNSSGAQLGMQRDARITIEDDDGELVLLIVVGYLFSHITTRHLCFET